MMFLPATSEETYVYIKKCEIQWEIEKSLNYHFTVNETVVTQTLELS